MTPLFVRFLRDCWLPILVAAVVWSAMAVPAFILWARSEPAATSQGPGAAQAGTDSASWEPPHVLVWDPHRS